MGVRFAGIVVLTVISGLACASKPTYPIVLPVTGSQFVEAEDFFASTHAVDTGVSPAVDHSWLVNYTPGRSGVSAMRALPDSGSNITLSNAASRSPRLDFQFTFQQAGNYRVWVRMFSKDSNANSVWVGISSTVPATPLSTALAIPTNNIWAWVQSASISVPATGTRFVSVYMGRDGAIVDAIYVANDGSTPSAITGSVAAANDFNLDGKSDIVWRNTTDGSLVQWLMNGTSVIQQSSLGGPGTTDSPKHVADFNGDGKADMIWQDTDGTVSMTLFDGAAVISDVVLVGPGTGWTVSHVADLDADGKADLVWTHADGSVQAWLMDGATAVASASFLPAGTGWSLAKIGDLNGDGKPDLIWQHTDGSSQAWFMNGLNVIGIQSFVGPGTGWSVALVADIDSMEGGGNQDIIWSNTDGSVQAWDLTGSGGFAYAKTLAPPGAGYTATHTADLNGDGTADILWRHTNGTVLAWIMTPGVTMVPMTVVSFTGSGNEWVVAHVLDLDGDGKSDLVWRHPDGSVQVWLMNGATVTSVAQLTGPGPYLIVPSAP